MEQHENAKWLIAIAESLKAMMKPADDDEEGYYDNADMKRMFNVCEKTLYRWRKSKQLKHTKIGGKIFYPKSTLRSLRKRGKGGQ